MNWQQLALTLLGVAVGGYVGVRVAVAVLQTKVSAMEEEIKVLRKAKHQHAGFLSQHELRITSLEKWRDGGR